MKKLLITLSLATVYFVTYAQTNTLPTSGSVGIGTTSPNSTLDIHGYLSLGGGSGNLDPGYPPGTLSYLANSGQMVIGWNRSGHAGEADFISNQASGNLGGFAFYNHDNSNVETQLFWLQANGLVGFNGYTFAPESRYQFNGGNDQYVIANRPSSGSAMGFGSATNNVSDWFYGTRENGNDYSIYNFAMSSDAISILKSNNNVGIGTRNPDQKLTVNGTIHAKQVNIDLNVPAPDYVFNRTYKLKSLSEVNRYILLNKHLPEIPSAATMAKDGVNVTELNMKLLQKVEELTLYLIAKDKQGKSQQQQLDAQQQQINLLIQQVSQLRKIDK